MWEALNACRDESLLNQLGIERSVNMQAQWQVSTRQRPCSPFKSPFNEQVKTKAPTCYQGELLLS